MPLQVAAELSGGAQAKHEPPQLSTLVLDLQTAPQAWKPALQVKPHVVPLHVAVAFAGVPAHGVQEVPQLAMSEFERHLSPQA